jgi:dephospho-CoA kinase
MPFASRAYHRLRNNITLTTELSLVRLGGMKVIGLSGGIGSGKSTVSRFLKELGAVVIDTDQVGHELFKPDTDAWREVVAAFGRQILTRQGEVDRNKLGEIVFASPGARARLNRIMHPRIRNWVKAEIEECRRQGIKLLVLEVPLLLEVSGPSLADEVDEVWITVAPEAAVLKRLKARSGMSEERTLARIRSQLPSEERIKHADVVINTDCSLNELKAKVGKLWPKLALDT